MRDGGHDRLGADAAERRDDLALAPQQRQRRRDHAGAQHAEQRQRRSRPCWATASPTTVSVCRPSPRKRAAIAEIDAVGLRISQPARRAVGEAVAVRRIGQRDRVGLAHAGAAEQVVERGAAAAASLPRHGRGPTIMRSVSCPPGFRQIAEQRGALGMRDSASSAPPIARGR